MSCTTSDLGVGGSGEETEDEEEESGDEVTGTSCLLDTFIEVGECVVCVGDESEVS